MELTSHSMSRMQQRGIPAEALDMVRTYGRRIHCAGAVFCFMGKKDLPDGLSGSDRERLEGLTLVLSPDTDAVVTVYRNKRALREIRRRKRYNRMNRSPDRCLVHAR